MSPAMTSIYTAGKTHTYLIKLSAACSLHCRDPFFHLTARLCTQHKSPEWGDQLGKKKNKKMKTTWNVTGHKINTIYGFLNVSISTKTRSKTIHDNVVLCLIYTSSNTEL